MGPISVTAQAGLDIIQKLAKGELEVHGILLRDTEGKKFRYILRGFEDLPKDMARLGGLPPLEPLHAALNVTQMLQLVTVAQNAAMAATLRRIEARIEALEKRIDAIQKAISRMESAMKQIQVGMLSQSVSRLKTSKATAVVALRHQDRNALISAGRDAQKSFHEFLEQAKHLARYEENGLPLAYRIPNELAELCNMASDAAYVASSIWMALGEQDLAAGVTQESAEGLGFIRKKMASALAGPEFLLRRMKADEGQDAALLAAGEQIRAAMHGSLGRCVMIKQGLIVTDQEMKALELVQPVDGLSFVPITELEAHGRG